MSSFKTDPRQKSHHQHILSEAEKLRHQPPKKQFYQKVKDKVTKNLQRFSGKRGK